MISIAAVIFAVVMQTTYGASPGQSAVQMDEGTKAQEIDQAGPYLIGNNKDRSKTVAEVREFLWRHWQQRRPGKLVATWHSKEGVPTKVTYVFEYDDGGVWSMRETDCRSTPKDQTEFRIYSIQRVKIPGPTWQGTYDSIADDAQIPGTAFLFLIRGPNGKNSPL